MRGEMYDIVCTIKLIKYVLYITIIIVYTKYIPRFSLRIDNKFERTNFVD
jgi:hypothetical protein